MGFVRPGFVALGMLGAIAACDVLSGIDGYVDHTGGNAAATSGTGGGAASSTASSSASATAGGGGYECSAAPEKDCAMVFVTSKLLPADFGGVAAADKLCAEESGGDLFVAWLDDDKVKGADRVADPPGGYCLKDGTRVSNSKADLLANKLCAPIDRDFTGIGNAEAFVWTGAGNNCKGWTSKEGNGMTGHTGSQNHSWRTALEQPCEYTEARIYCFPKK
jgi:hypothetical protein